MKNPPIETYKNILRETYRLFLTENIERVTVIDIENATKRTRGTFFHYFRDKQDLFEKTVEKQYLVQLKKKGYPTNAPIDFEDFINNYKSPSERVTAHIKALYENINAEKAFCHFTLQASRYYPDFDTVYNRIIEKEYIQITSILSQLINHSLKVEINTIACLLISNNCCNTFFNALPTFNNQNKRIIKSLLQR
jgi:AcrR family transcriptional regulator